jgi:hypothetical protein
MSEHDIELINFAETTATHVDSTHSMWRYRNEARLLMDDTGSVRKKCRYPTKSGERFAGSKLLRRLGGFWKHTPPDITMHILQYVPDIVAYRNGRWMNRISRDDVRYTILRTIPIKIFFSTNDVIETHVYLVKNFCRRYRIIRSEFHNRILHTFSTHSCHTYMTHSNKSTEIV